MSHDNSATGYTHPPARGLVVTNPGGRLGWLARRFAPGLSTRAYLAFIRASRARKTRERLAAFMRTPDMPRFTHLEIETFNRCNGECSFCPVNKNADSRPRQKMREELFDSLLRQLHDMEYSGYLGLFSNNEPLLDSRIGDFSAAARAALPHAFLNLSTNGSLLTPEKLAELLPRFNRVVVNNYDTRPVMKPRVRQLFEYLRTAEGRRLLEGGTVEISLRNSGDILTSRAGTSPNRPPPARPPALPCSLPCSQMIVRPDGKVSLCCNDALGQITLGDLAVESMLDVWHGEPFRRVRTAMFERGRAALPLCRECDFVKHDVN